ncbi:MAG: hypothetical protein AMS15_02220 [Planctomycetes bacterium DG_23]|nr:MAG: hypothetical protein AMS15_02220 [Planctomycetes bacterium DG_23]
MYAIWTPGPWEIALIAIIALILFGGKRLPEVGRALGKGIVEFKKGLKGVQDEIEKAGEKKEDEKEEEASKEDSPEN